MTVCAGETIRNIAASERRRDVRKRTYKSTISFYLLVVLRFSLAASRAAVYHESSHRLVASLTVILKK